jgi:hypothetical protein
VVFHRQAVEGKGTGEMNQLVESFRAIHGAATKQIGRYYCIPAAVSNALRVLGSADFTQQRIQQERYAEKGRQPEADIDDQMTGAGFDVVETLVRRTSFSKTFEREGFCRPGDQNPSNLQKADEALTFIERHLSQHHPVIVSTWSVVPQSGTLSASCCHMWLILAIDRSLNTAIVHDSSDNQFFPVPVSYETIVPVGPQFATLNTGLRGRITRSDYSCLALWKERK